MKKFLLFFSCLISTFSSFAQSIIHVTPTGAGNNSGSSWANALPGVLLPNRVVSASAGTQFWVAAGTYKPTTTTDRTASFSIASGVSVYGGFAGTETALEQRTIGFETIFSGNIGNEADSQDNSQHVVSIYNTGNTINLDSLTIRDGRIKSLDSGSSGAGINIDITNTALDIVITSCRFDNNVIEVNFSGGGAIGVIARANSLCNVTIKNCHFFSNKAGFGGALVSQTLGGTITSLIENCDFGGNQGLSESGAISNRYVGESELNSLTIKKCIFVYNSAFYRGGAITTGASQCTIENCYFSENFISYSNPSPISQGGAIDLANSNSRLKNCTFLYNSAINGGAIEGSDSKSIFTNCIFAHNKATRGGAIYSTAENKATEQTFINCTFLRNTAILTGGAFYNILFETRTQFVPFDNATYLRNCLIWGNAAPDSPVFKKQRFTFNEGSQYVGRPYATYSIIQDLDQVVDGTGTGNLNTDPLFVDPANGNFRLKPNSPAINAGDPTSTDLTTTDLDGQPRVQGGRVDLGAYEFANCFGFPCLPFTVERKK